MREIGRDEVGVASKIDEADVDDKLYDLQHGDIFLPPNANSTCGLEIVPVHYNMHEQVDGDRNP